MAREKETAPEEVEIMVGEKETAPDGKNRERFEELVNANFQGDLLVKVTYETAQESLERAD